jgi:hypothetical protein
MTGGALPSSRARNLGSDAKEIGVRLNIKHLSVAFTLTAALLVSACSGGQNEGLPKESGTPSPTQTTDNNDSVTIPTPSPTPVVYEGEQKTFSDLLAALKQAYPADNWTQSTKANDQINNSEVSFKSIDSCTIHGYQSFQSAIDNDFGSYGDSWTTFGSFGQLGTILLGTDSCVEKTSTVIRYPGFGQTDAGTEVLTARSENINYCLAKLSACFLDGGVNLPERSSSSFDKALTELDDLAKARFCVDPYFSGGPGGLNSCEASTDNPGIQEGDFISEVSTDLDILRLAATTPSEQRFGKYMIYGDGWALFIRGSTESYNQTFIEMNKVIKGTLIAKY